MNDIPAPTSTRPEDVAVAPASGRVPSLHNPKACSACLYTNLGVMSAAAIEAAFSGHDGTLRETPETYQRTRDRR